MRVYRVIYESRKNGQQGYTWHSSEGLARWRARTYVKESRYDRTAVVEPVDVKATRAAIVATLNIYASHNDNG